MGSLALGVVLVLLLSGHLVARLSDARRARAARRKGNARAPWRMPSRFRPVRRFKARARMWQWGEFVNTRPGRTEQPYGEPEVVTFRDFASFVRVWPNPGYTITGRHWCANRKCPTPRRLPR